MIEEAVDTELQNNKLGIAISILLNQIETYLGRRSSSGKDISKNYAAKAAKHCKAVKHCLSHRRCDRLRPKGEDITHCIHGSRQGAEPMRGNVQSGLVEGHADAMSLEHLCRREGDPPQRALSSW